MRVPLSLRLKYTAGKYLPFLKIQRPPDREVVFRLRPVRNEAIQWQLSESGEATLGVPARKDRFGKLLAFWFRLPETRTVQLDEVGTFVWSLCDGTQTVDGIIRKFCKHFSMNRREVEMSVTTFLQILAERNFIAFYQRGGSK